MASLEAVLKDISQMRADALQAEDVRQSGYQALKTYLMLAQPQRTESAFLKKALVATWRFPPGMSSGERDDLARRLAGFYADHLKAHPDWRTHIAEPLVTAARNMLVSQMGLANADDTVYQAILDDVKGKYADASLTDAAQWRERAWSLHDPTDRSGYLHARRVGRHGCRRHRQGLQRTARERRLGAGQQ